LAAGDHADGMATRTSMINRSPGCCLLVREVNITEERWTSNQYRPCRRGPFAGSGRWGRSVRSDRTDCKRASYKRIFGSLQRDICSRSAIPEKLACIFSVPEVRTRCPCCPFNVPALSLRGGDHKGDR
jgi:hypothetical protein